MHGYLARGGQMVDASTVQVPTQSLRKEEKAIADQGAMPADWTQAKRRQKVAKTRARAEHALAGLAQLSGEVLRSIGLARATLHLN